jgi:hypothetical protein
LVGTPDLIGHRFRQAAGTGRDPACEPIDDPERGAGARAGTKTNSCDIPNIGTEDLLASRGLDLPRCDCVSMLTHGVPSACASMSILLTSSLSISNGFVRYSNEANTSMSRGSMLNLLTSNELGRTMRQ